MSKIFNENHGFTLIELIVVFTIITIISSVGIAAFVNYSRSQTLNTATLEVFTMLNKAKSRALSQVKPDRSPFCSNATVLEGYKVTISISTSSYELQAVCSGGPATIETKKLPANVTFDSLSDTAVFFPVLKGGAEEKRITINGYGSSNKTIKVDVMGNIKITN